jgi:hypothetical protein
MQFIAFFRYESTSHRLLGVGQGQSFGSPFLVRLRLRQFDLDSDAIFFFGCSAAIVRLRLIALSPLSGDHKKNWLTCAGKCSNLVFEHTCLPGVQMKIHHTERDEINY